MQALQRAATPRARPCAATQPAQPLRHAITARVRPSPVSPAGRHLLQVQPRSRAVACRGLFGLGLPEIAVIAGIAALVFGPSKLPELGKGLGQTVKSFQTAAKEFETELKAAAAPDESAAGTEEAKKDVASKQPEGVKKD